MARSSELNTVLALALVSSTLAPIRGVAQQHDLILEPACPACEIQDQEVAVLGTREGPGMLPGAPVHVARDDLGRYWLAFNAPELVMVFEGDGTPLGTVGRRGEGPGEFRMATALTAIGDSVVIYDAQLRRASVVGPDLTVRRSVPLRTQVWYSTSIGWPRVVVNTVGQDPGGHGLRFQVFNVESGESEGAFGPVARPGVQGQVAPVATPASQQDRFWTSERLSLRISEWSADGTVLQELSATPSWFPDGVDGRPGGPDEPPDPLVQAIAGWDDRLLMVAAVPGPRWREAWPRARERAPHAGAATPSASDLWQARVLVIDPDARRVVTLGDRDWLVVSLLPDGEVALYEDSDLARPTIRIVRLRVQPGA